MSGNEIDGKEIHVESDGSRLDEQMSTENEIRDDAKP